MLVDGQVNHCLCLDPCFGIYREASTCIEFSIRRVGNDTDGAVSRSNTK